MQDRRATPRSTPERRRASAGGDRERRSAPRLQTLRLGRLHVEPLDLRAATVHQAAWAALAARALQPNPFFEPEFVLPAAQGLPGPRRPLILVVRKAIAGQMRLIGLLPLAPNRQRFGFAPVRGWRNDLMALGGPLLDREHAAEAFAAMLAWVSTHRPGAGGLMLNAVPTDGLLTQAIRAAAAAQGAGYRAFEPHQRAALFAGVDPRAALSGKRLKSLDSARRRLAAQGALAFAFEHGAAASDAFDRYLALEASGWKGRRGTALAQQPVLLALARVFVRRLARQGRAFVAALTLDGAPVAAGVVATSGDLAVYWKTAYDERYASCSPGVLLTLDLTAALLATPSIRITDSCAVPGHAMIESLWSDRIDVADILIGGAGNGFSHALATHYERLRRGLRSGAKQVYCGLAGRRPV